MNGKPTRVERTRKRTKCPQCGHAPVAVILWGLPKFSEKLKQGLDEGYIALGGCCVSDDDPAWQCTKCGLKIFCRGSGD